MVTAKLAFVLIQVGSNLWVNPMQVQGVCAVRPPYFDTTCQAFIIANGPQCTDWAIDKVREALAPAMVSKALEGK